VQQTPDMARQLNDYLGQHMREPLLELEEDGKSAASDSDASFDDLEIDGSAFPNINLVGIS
jgi:hypothetical protein